MYDVIIVGGGIAGLISSTLMSRSGLKVLLLEKNTYPFHRVCGEYVSNEVKPFLIRNNLFPDEIHPTSIKKFRLTSIHGRAATLDLDMGGFGISRYSFDQFLYKRAQSAGAEVLQSKKVDGVSFDGHQFAVKSGTNVYHSKLVIGSYGKRSNLDRGRKFMKSKSPYLGVKYHIKTQMPSDEIALHNFNNGYCGISQVENGIFNLCYLTHRNNLKPRKTISEMEERVLNKNPFLEDIWLNSDFLFEEPLVINEISFVKKEPVENHILMCGDTAGMITPLCGNGMAMAIRSAKILSELILKGWCNGDIQRTKLESAYTTEWNRAFANRLWAGRTIQRLFGSEWTSNLAVNLAKVKPIGSGIVSLTHGKAF